MTCRVATMVSIPVVRSLFRANTDEHTVPLGNRRRFGPAVPEESAPVRLAAVSPSAFPVSRPAPQQEAPKAPSEPSKPSFSDHRHSPASRLRICASSLASSHTG
jgi:hypothetical protein